MMMAYGIQIKAQTNASSNIYRPKEKKLQSLIGRQRKNSHDESYPAAKKHNHHSEHRSHAYFINEQRTRPLNNYIVGIWLQNTTTL
jgi:hypothetical protein